MEALEGDEARRRGKIDGQRLFSDRLQLNPSLRMPGRWSTVARRSGLGFALRTATKEDIATAAATYRLPVDLLPILLPLSLLLLNGYSLSFRRRRFSGIDVSVDGREVGVCPGAGSERREVRVGRRRRRRRRGAGVLRELGGRGGEAIRRRPHRGTAPLAIGIPGGTGKVRGRNRPLLDAVFSTGVVDTAAETIERLPVSVPLLFRL